MGRPGVLSKKLKLTRDETDVGVGKGSGGSDHGCQQLEKQTNKKDPTANFLIHRGGMKAGVYWTKQNRRYRVQDS